MTGVEDFFPRKRSSKKIGEKPTGEGTTTRGGFFPHVNVVGRNSWKSLLERVDRGGRLFYHVNVVGKIVKKAYWRVNQTSSLEHRQVI